MTIGLHMQSAQVLIQRNLQRARYSLPFFDPGLRDLITLIPPLLSEGSPSVGIYGRPGCSAREYKLLAGYLGRKPAIIADRLPDRVLIESLIALPMPSLAGRHSTSLMLVCLLRDEDYGEEVRAKIASVAQVFEKIGTPLTGVVGTGPLGQLLVYDIMRTGIVLAGKHPVTNKNAASDACIYIGGLPGIITEMHEPARRREWNPFSHYLDNQTAEFIRKKDYPSALSAPSANPFIIPYLHMLHHHEEHMDRGQIEKMRMSLLGLFSSFPPTREFMQGLRAAWKMDSVPEDFRGLDFTGALRLRKWIVPLERDELPVFSWPPSMSFELDRLDLVQERRNWGIAQTREFRHAHAWVVLTWAALAGLAGRATRITAPRELHMKPSARNILLEGIDALLLGKDSLIPQDHLQGAIHLKEGRFFFSSGPFAILEKGNKHCIELFETIKKKALLDDINLGKDRKKE
ncbi:MAG: hypothetical protein ACOX3E_08635 [Desulfomonilia bacterium]|jgi:hypothetical protein|nr:hypothetical protein [Pseudomonadota bacterium]HPD22455.1 hypothetical protein [Deltaproteobacteria bacterium]HPX19496.1 hypothetical protein [Deltaproteobacteria bacterium]HRS56858.1 hypothetical protein [Desulfomonilia bacterium]HRV36883.1 hypothetical protein [Desulfomonilia bacterium]